MMAIKVDPMNRPRKPNAPKPPKTPKNGQRHRHFDADADKPVLDEIVNRVDEYTRTTINTLQAD